MSDDSPLPLVTSPEATGLFKGVAIGVVILFWSGGDEGILVALLLDEGKIHVSGDLSWLPNRMSCRTCSMSAIWFSKLPDGRTIRFLGSGGEKR